MSAKSLGELRDGTPCATQASADERWATGGLWGGGLPRPAGRKPYGRGAARRSARPHPQAGGAGRNAPR
ncbi:MAG: hypothetical protein ACXVCF_19675 [Isosphaeraceae bacterium]